MTDTNIKILNELKLTNKLLGLIAKSMGITVPEEAVKPIPRISDQFLERMSYAHVTITGPDS